MSSCHLGESTGRKGADRGKDPRSSWRKTKTTCFLHRFHSSSTRVPTGRCSSGFGGSSATWRSEPPGLDGSAEGTMVRGLTGLTSSKGVGYTGVLFCFVFLSHRCSFSKRRSNISVIKWAGSFLHPSGAGCPHVHFRLRTRHPFDHRPFLRDEAHDVKPHSQVIHGASDEPFHAILGEEVGSWLLKVGPLLVLQKKALAQNPSGEGGEEEFAHDRPRLAARGTPPSYPVSTSSHST